MIPLDDVVSIARLAGERILEFYGQPGEVFEKGDGSPLTLADRAAHDLLVRELRSLDPGFPVLSEESDPSEVTARSEWRTFWLVDPLDGTKEFLRGTGEFTVNVALIGEGRPVAGVVHVPALGRTYRATEGGGAESSEDGEGFRGIRTRRFPAESPVLVASKDHAGPAVQALAHALGEGVRLASMGSSLKFCLVAEGRADLYLRDGPTMEWDTAAAQCIVEAAGGRVYAVSGEPLAYNKIDLRNPSFVAVGDSKGPWRGLMRGLPV